MYFVFDWELGDQYEFASLEEVKNFLRSVVEDLEEDQIDDYLEGVQIIKGEEVEVVF